MNMTLLQSRGAGTINVQEIVMKAFAHFRWENLWRGFHQFIAKSEVNHVIVGSMALFLGIQSSRRIGLTTMASERRKRLKSLKDLAQSRAIRSEDDTDTSCWV